MEEYSNILLPNDLKHFGRHYVVDDSHMIASTDPSGLPFLLEELICIGSIKVLIDSASTMSDSFDKLPLTIKKRTEIVNKDNRVNEALDYILAPLLDEFGITYHYAGSMFTTGSQYNLKPPDILWWALYNFRGYIYPFMMGILYQSKITINLKQFLKTTLVIYKFSKNPESRARLSLIIGLLNSYKKFNYQGVYFKSNVSEDHIYYLNELMNDATYHQLSKEMKYFGIPTKSKYVASKILNLSKKIIHKQKFKSLLGISSNFINATANVPISTNEFTEIFGKKTFLPPIVSFKKIEKKASKNWKNISPNPIIPKDVEERLINQDSLDIKNIKHISFLK